MVVQHQADEHVMNERPKSIRISRKGRRWGWDDRGAGKYILRSGWRSLIRLQLDAPIALAVRRRSTVAKPCSEHGVGYAVGRHPDQLCLKRHWKTHFIVPIGCNCVERTPVAPPV
jgi:hypothetical protein